VTNVWAGLRLSSLMGFLGVGRLSFGGTLRRYIVIAVKFSWLANR